MQTFEQLTHTINQFGIGQLAHVDAISFTYHRTPTEPTYTIRVQDANHTVHLYTALQLRDGGTVHVQHIQLETKTVESSYVNINTPLEPSAPNSTHWIASQLDMWLRLHEHMLTELCVTLTRNEHNQPCIHCQFTPFYAETLTSHTHMELSMDEHFTKLLKQEHIRYLMQRNHQQLMKSCRVYQLAQ